MKRYIAIFLSVILILSAFAGCKQQPVEESVTESESVVEVSQEEKKPAFEIPDFMRYENCKMTEEKKAEQQKASDELAARMAVIAEELEAEKKAAEESKASESKPSGGNASGGNTSGGGTTTPTQPEPQPQSNPEPEEEVPAEEGKRVIKHNLCHDCMEEFEGEVCPYCAVRCPVCKRPYTDPESCELCRFFK